MDNSVTKRIVNDLLNEDVYSAKDNIINTLYCKAADNLRDSTFDIVKRNFSEENAVSFSIDERHATLPTATGFAVVVPYKNNKEDIKLATIVGSETDKKGLVQSGKKDSKSKTYRFTFSKNSDRVAFRKKYKEVLKSLGECFELDEAEQSPEQKAFRKLFDRILAKFGVDSPNDLEDSKKDDFFDEVEREWKKDPANDNEGEGEEDDTDESAINEQRALQDFFLKLLGLDQTEIQRQEKLRRKKKEEEEEMNDLMDILLTPGRQTGDIPGVEFMTPDPPPG